MDVRGAQLAAAIDRLGELSSKIDIIILNPDTDGMRDFIYHRREVSEILFGLSAMVSEWIAHLAIEDRQKAEADFRAALNDVRRALLLLQADWPMPRIQDNIVEFRVAKTGFNYQLDEFLSKVRSMLKSSAVRQ
jgi:hypothetical protein